MRVEPRRRKVIIDCDPGIDDSLALMLALSMEEIQVEAITVVCGNCPADMGAANARKVLKQMGRLDVPVYVGADQPLSREYASALDTHGPDGLGGSFLPEAEGGVQTMGAVEYLSAHIRACALAGTPCSVIALGPMTNLALLIREDPGSFAMIGELVSMGGNFRSHGNCSPVAEYNYWEDPDAAALVYRTAAETGRKIHMVGLDVTRQIVLTPNRLAYLARRDPKLGGFVQAITKFYFQFHWEWEHIIGCVINDPLAVAYFADRSLCGGFEAYTEVVTDGTAMGQTVVDSMGFYKKPANALVLTETDPKRFFRFFFGWLLHVPEESLEELDRI